MSTVHLATFASFLNQFVHVGISKKTSKKSWKKKSNKWIWSSKRKKVHLDLCCAMNRKRLQSRWWNWAKTTVSKLSTVNPSWWISMSSNVSLNLVQIMRWLVAIIVFHFVPSHSPSSSLPFFSGLGIRSPNVFILWVSQRETHKIGIILSEERIVSSRFASTMMRSVIRW